MLGCQVDRTWDRYCSKLFLIWFDNRQPTSKVQHKQTSMLLSSSFDWTRCVRVLFFTLFPFVYCYRNTTKYRTIPFRKPIKLFHTFFLIFFSFSLELILVCLFGENSSFKEHLLKVEVLHYVSVGIPPGSQLLFESLIFN